MKFNLYASGQLVYYLGCLHRVIWASREQVKLQLVGTYGAGMTMMQGVSQSLSWNQRTVSPRHWSLVRCP